VVGRLRIKHSLQQCVVIVQTLDRALPFVEFALKLNDMKRFILEFSDNGILIVDLLLEIPSFGIRLAFHSIDENTLFLQFGFTLTADRAALTCSSWT
jgi:hypothetical protein